MEPVRQRDGVAAETKLKRVPRQETHGNGKWMAARRCRDGVAVEKKLKRVPRQETWRGQNIGYLFF
jgi:hypothetical protein